MKKTAALVAALLAIMTSICSADNEWEKLQNDLAKIGCSAGARSQFDTSKVVVQYDNKVNTNTDHRRCQNSLTGNGRRNIWNDQ
jgi:hypothetical protein